MRSLQAVSKAGRWIVVVGVVGAVGVGHRLRRQPVVAPPLGRRRHEGVAAPRVAALGAKAKKPKLGGLSFGGLTPQGWPVVIQVSRNLKHVTRAIIGLDENCTPSMDVFGTSDFYGGRRDLFVPMNKAHKFAAAFGPHLQPEPAGRHDRDRAGLDLRQAQPHAHEGVRDVAAHVRHQERDHRRRRRHLRLRPRALDRHAVADRQAVRDPRYCRAWARTATAT